jgi:hypothetical protein
LNRTAVGWRRIAGCVKEGSTPALYFDSIGTA